MADRLEHRPVTDQSPEARIIASPNRPPTSAEATKALKVSHGAHPGADTGHQLDVACAHAADRIER